MTRQQEGEQDEKFLMETWEGRRNREGDRIGEMRERAKDEGGRRASSEDERRRLISLGAPVLFR